VYGGRNGKVGMLPEGKPDILARRVRRAIERGSARLIYPRFYNMNRWFPGLSRWLVDSAVPRPPAA
jgi:hypothetical protein